VKTVVAPKPPLWDQFSLNFDAHITEWHMRKVNPPLTYLKDRCAELGWSFTVIIGPQRRDKVVEVRHQLMWEISERFRISLPQIGRLFGGRDHSTALYAIRKVEARMVEARA
jgi:chromosomal replication initiation ATPase DnaA